MRIGVQGQEQIGLGRLGPRHPFAQAPRTVAAARQHHAIAAAGLQFALELAGNGHDHGLFLGAANALRAGILAAVAGVEEDQLRLGAAAWASPILAMAAFAQASTVPRPKAVRPDKRRADRGDGGQTWQTPL